MKCIPTLFFLFSWLNIPLITTAQTATLTVYKDSVINITNPLLFGTGDEIIQNFSHPKLDSMLTTLASPMIRFGGISTEYFDWEANNYNGAYYVDYDDVVITVQPTGFGIDSMLRFCERNNLEPILTVSYHLNDPEKAARLVEYCNGDLTTPMGSIRAANGHPLPYNVTYWCIGNEVHTAQWSIPTSYPENFLLHRHFGIPFADWTKTDTSFVTPGAYDALVSNYIDSMRPKSATPLQIGVSVGGDFSWFEQTLSNNSHKIDWVDTHLYTCWGYNSDTVSYEKCFAQLDTGYKAMGVENWYNFVVDTVKQMANGIQLPVFITEYNSGVFSNDTSTIWSNFLNGLYLADVVGHFLKAGVPASATYNSYSKPGQNNDVFSLIKGDTISFRTGAHALKAYIDHFGETSIESNSDQFGLNVYASNTSANEISVFVINKDLHSDFNTTINLQGYQYDSIHVFRIQNDTTMAEPYNGTKGLLLIDSLGFTPNNMTYSFPKASLTILKFTPSETNSLQPKEVAKQLVTVFPNPHKEAVSFKFNLEKTAAINLKIYNTLGSMIDNIHVKGEAGENSIKWSSPTLDKNQFYFYAIHVNGTPWTNGKFIKLE